MKRYFLIFLVLVAAFSSCVQKQTEISRPKLVVGLVVDQMRWDYLYRYYNRYGNDGFKRLLRDGFSCEHTMINYIPSYTAPGHACIYTGSVPSINGIAGNDWIDNQTGRICYCVEDTTIHSTSDTKASLMSPRNLLTTTITDELRLATNFGSRVYGVAIKDRGCILPAGHLANGAYWFDDSTGTFGSSSYYPDAAPQWLTVFNKRNLADSLIKQNWTLLYPANTYTQSLPDDNRYEKSFKGEKAPVFPHIMDSLTGKSKYSALKIMPAGNTITLEMAKACIDGEKLGSGGNTDFLCISLSSSDYIGHRFAPNSMEVEDMYLRLDKDIATFLNYLDRVAGRENYLFFITADHGAAHNQQFMIDKNVPAGSLDKDIVSDLNTYLESKYGKDSIITNFTNYQFYLNDRLVAQLGRDKVKEDMMQWLGKRPEIAYVIDLEHINNAQLPEPVHTMVINGYNRHRSGCIEIILNPGWYDSEGTATGTTHGTWNPYDTHIPLLWYGWHIPKGKTNDQVNMTDISATLAALLHIQMPNGCIGKPINLNNTPNP